MISSELFGHTAGAFTGAREVRVGVIEEANKGTLFLDEIDTLPPQTQIALLHVLQEKEFHKIGSSKTIRSDFRLISATNSPFDQLVGREKLRGDFYHRIAHIVIHIPPLRERREDIPMLAQQFLDKLASSEEGQATVVLSTEASLWLSAQEWPGNVRELQATVERAHAQAQIWGRRFIFQKDLEPPTTRKVKAVTGTLTEQLEAYELAITVDTFTKLRQNHSATARFLGIDRKRLRRILARTGFGL